MVRILRYEVDPDVPRFPLQHVFHDLSQLMQETADPLKAYEVGEMTKPGETSYGWRQAPSKKYQHNILDRRFWEPKEPEGFPAGQWFGSEKAFLGQLEEDGTWGGKLLNPWTATDEELSEIPAALKARFQRHADSCHCSPHAGHGVSVTLADQDACECQTADAQAVNLVGGLGEACECQTADCIIT